MIYLLWKAREISYKIHAWNGGEKGLAGVPHEKHKERKLEPN